MSFSDEISAFCDAMEQRASDVHNTTVELTKQSWQFGSELTGSPGVIVDTGNLRNSIVREDVAPTESVISTNVEYAQSIEDGISNRGTPLTQRQPTGGFHALALTIAGFDRIVDATVTAVAQ